jgi:predicted acyl esterase
VTVPAGHRLRLEIASAAFPEYSRNLNTGKHNERTTRFVVARQRVHRGGRFASRLNLPVLRLDDD